MRSQKQSRIRHLANVQNGADKDGRHDPDSDQQERGLALAVETLVAARTADGHAVVNAERRQCEDAADHCHPCSKKTALR